MSATSPSISERPAKSNRVVIIKINDRCPLHCRHCSLGFSEDYKGNAYRMSEEVLADTIAQIDPAVYGVVLFTGGEPSLEPALLRVGIMACKFQGLLSALSTAPVWAASRSSAERFLDNIPGLDVMMLSYDQYHLEFLPVGHYETAVRVARGRGLMLGVNVCYTDDAEKEDLFEKISSVSDLIQIVNVNRTVLVGNAAKPDNLKLDYLRIESVNDLERIPRSCTLGNILIDESHAVHGCCWSQTVTKSPLSIKKQPDGLAATLNTIEQSQLFQSVRTHGFIDALNPKGKEALVRLIKGRNFVNQCHVCLTAMKEARSEIWSEYV
jgi:MoaA/NifB/PqqE/SkfB family radical SAM enzyme